nr:nuclear transport factor 2 family protein [Sphingomonas sp. CDS-1]
MSVSDNKNLVRAFFEAFARFDVEAMNAFLAEDATWWSAHSTGMSGSYDKPALLGMIEAFKPQAAAPREFRFNDDWTAEEDRVAFTARASLKLTSGKVFEGDFGFLVTVKDGKIAGGKEYYDSRAVNEIFFTAA